MSHITGLRSSLRTISSPLRSHTTSILPLRSISPIVSTTVLQARWASGKGRWAKSSSQSPVPNEMKMSDMKERSIRELFSGEEMPLLPTIFVSLPWKDYPSTTKDIWKYTKFRATAYFTDLSLFWRAKLASRKGFSFQLKSKRRSIAPTAKVLWQEMLEAFAAGDKATLTRICRVPYARQMNNMISKRPREHEVRFQLLEWLSPRLYPSLVAYNVSPADQDSDLWVEQAVVALKSRQQVATVDKLREEQVPGTVRLQEKVEYVVLIRWFKQGEWQLGPWKIWGTTLPTGLKEWSDKMDAIEVETAYKAGMQLGERMKKDRVAVKRR